LVCTGKGDLTWPEGLALNDGEKLIFDGSFGINGVDKVAWSGVITATEYRVLHVVDVE
jgi:hypothetical protein